MPKRKRKCASVLPRAGVSRPAVAKVKKVKMKKKLRGWDWWRSVGSPRYVCAPMVDQSERAFRALTFRYNVTLSYTPMLLASIIDRDPAYRQMYVVDDLARPHEDGHEGVEGEGGEVGQEEEAEEEEEGEGEEKDEEDAHAAKKARTSAGALVERPLLAQLGGTDAATLVSAAKWIESSGLPVDAIDLNLGCPQSCAKRGGELGVFYHYCCFYYSYGYYRNH